MNLRDATTLHAGIDHVQQDLERYAGRHADSPHVQEAMDALTRAMDALRALGAELLEEERSTG
jgi:hypothetical protein